MPYKDKKVQNDFTRKWRADKRQKLAGLKKGPCTDCGNTYPYYVMDFDHRGEKLKGVALMAIQNKWEDVLAEIAKCDLVCANCHRVRTHLAKKHMPLKWS